MTIFMLRGEFHKRDLTYPTTASDRIVHNRVQKCPQTKKIYIFIAINYCGVVIHQLFASLPIKRKQIFYENHPSPATFSFVYLPRRLHLSKLFRAKISHCSPTRRTFCIMIIRCFNSKNYLKAKVTACKTV